MFGYKFGEPVRPTGEKFCVHLERRLVESCSYVWGEFGINSNISTCRFYLNLQGHLRNCQEYRKVWARMHIGSAFSSSPKRWTCSLFFNVCVVDCVSWTSSLQSCLLSPEEYFLEMVYKLHMKCLAQNLALGELSKRLQSWFIIIRIVVAKSRTSD